jgi:hypothetical protein
MAKKVGAAEIASLGGTKLAAAAKPAVAPAPSGVRKYEPLNIGECVEWVLNALGDETLTRANAPSDAAWAMLKWARDCPNDFYSSYAARLLPSKTAVDKRNRFSNDGSGVDKLVELLSDGVDDEF